MQFSRIYSNVASSGKLEKRGSIYGNVRFAQGRFPIASNIATDREMPKPLLLRTGHQRLASADFVLVRCRTRRWSSFSGVYFAKCPKTKMGDDRIPLG